MSFGIAINGPRSGRSKLLQKELLGILSRKSISSTKRKSPIPCPSKSGNATQQYGKTIEENVDLSITRPGQDVRYALNDDKLRSLGWEPKRNFDEEIKDIVEYYKGRFIW